MADPTPTDRTAPQSVPIVPLPGRTRFGVPLPAPPTSFVGREREVAAVAALLRRDGVRLVTLTGPGGVGKTRLAVRVAEELAGAFPDGAAFVALAPVADPDLVAPTLAQALGVRDAGDRPLVERLGDALRDRALLLLLDNFEQVVEAAPLVAGLLAACPRLTVLVTSRTVLRLSGEHDVAVRPLGLPRAEGQDSAEVIAMADSVRLFAARAQAARSDYALTDADAPAVAQLCRRLDGLPLAIELAAARVAHLPPTALLRRLEPRLPLLTGGPRDQPARLRTMRDAIAWSHDLLTPEEQALFRRLSVFAGGCTLEAAEAVAAAAGEHGIGVLDGLGSLVDKSLLRPEAGPDGEARFGMLETVREFGLERLAASGEEAGVRDRHAAWCLDLAERFRVGAWNQSELLAWLRRAEGEHDNLRAALAWLDRAGDGERLLRLAEALHTLWYEHTHHAEGIGWLERALAGAPAAPTEVRLRAVTALGFLLERLGRYERADAAHREELDLARELGDPGRTAWGLQGLGLLAVNQGRYDEGTPLVEAALAAFERAGDEVGVKMARYVMGIAAYGRGDVAAAVAHVEDVLARRRASGDTLGRAPSLDALALLRCEQGDDAGAAALLVEALPLWQEAENRSGLAEWLAAVARLAACRAQCPLAARLYGAAEALGEWSGAPLLLPPRSQYRRHLDALRAVLGADAFAEGWAVGRGLPLERAVGEARAVVAGPAPAGATPPAGAPEAGPALTRREREVLRLIAEGRTDREIAAALFIGARTVEWHLTNAFNKLGVGTRAAAAAAALRRGLI